MGSYTKRRPAQGGGGSHSSIWGAFESVLMQFQSKGLWHHESYDSKNKHDWI